MLPILDAISDAIRSPPRGTGRTIALEAGKPIKTARAEVDRAVFTFKVAAEETKRIYGEIVPLDWLPGLEGREAHIRRVPLGPVAGITPFNFPLNLVAHKVAPALAAGNPVIIRPALRHRCRPSCWVKSRCRRAGPPGYSVVPSTTREAAPLIEDDRIKLLSFTGSPAVGWELKRRAGRKRVTLELGGNAAVIVHRDADIDYAAERIVWGGFSYAGQSCISAQRIYIHADVLRHPLESAGPAQLPAKTGDPLDEATDVGPVIDAVASDRIEEWIGEATTPAPGCSSAVNVTEHSGPPRFLPRSPRPRVSTVRRSSRP